MLKQFKRLVAIVKQPFNSPQMLPRQYLNITLIAVGVGLTLIIIIGLVSATSKNKSVKKAEEIPAANLKIEVASKALDPEKMWRNHFEEKLNDSNHKLEEKLELIHQSLQQKEQQVTKKAAEEVSVMQEQLQFARKELQEAMQELKNAKLATSSPQSGVEKEVVPSNISANVIEQERPALKPKDSKQYIPETGYVTGILLGGISVSTAAGSSSEPTPVVIRITSHGNLPKNFAVDLKTCRILGSSYGDLSSERAIIRAETLSCHDARSEQILTTKIAGVIYGDDGMGGIKGKVVETRQSKVKNALLGGLLSGFAGTAKAADQFSITSLGAISTKQSNTLERFQDGGMKGLGNAGEKIADYYLKQAEMMSPVLQIPGGTRVDVVFTKGVYLGSTDVKEQLAKSRGAQ